MMQRLVSIALAASGSVALVAASGAGGAGAEPGSAARAAPAKIVFFASRGPGSELYVVNPDGSGKRRLTTKVTKAGEASLDVGPSWSPDHKRVAFTRLAAGTRNEDVYVVNADGSGLRKLVATKAFERPGNWSPDGTQIVFSRQLGRQSDLFVVRVATRAVRRLTATTATEAVPAWSPDGRSIAYARDGRIWVMRARGGGAHSLGPSLGVDWSPNWSPDSRRILFASNRSAESQTTEVWVMHADGKDRRPITRNWVDETTPAWSPDGTRIAFCREGEIWTMRADGGYQKRLATGSAPDW